VIRPFTEEDRPALHELYAEFYDELPPPSYHSDTLEHELGEVDELTADGVAFVAENEGRLVGLVLGRLKGRSEGYVSELFVKDGFRRRGTAKQLLRAAAEALRAQGADHVTLNVDVDNTNARAVYERLGFRPDSMKLVIGAEELVERTGAAPRAASFGSVHVQTDDRAAVDKAVDRFLPRLGSSAGTAISEPRNGWVAVYDELCDRDPAALRRLARELSDRIGAVTLSIGLEEGVVVRYVLFDRGRVADEYASLPEHYGPLAPGDVIALRANPTVAARLTGADPGRLRAAAPTGTSAAELPPPQEVLAAVAAALGIEGAEHGWIESGA
jgi:ribosomal protein S18 acetylase RimI-like enzyme